MSEKDSTGKKGSASQNKNGKSLDYTEYFNEKIKNAYIDDDLESSLTIEMEKVDPSKRKAPADNNGSQNRPIPKKPRSADTRTVHKPSQKKSSSGKAGGKGVPSHLRPSRDGYSQKSRDASGAMNKVISRMSESVSTKSEKRRTHHSEAISERIRKYKKKNTEKTNARTFAKHTRIGRFFIKIFGSSKDRLISDEKIERVLDKLSSYLYKTKLHRSVDRVHMLFCFSEARVYGISLLAFGLFVLLGLLGNLLFALPYVAVGYPSIICAIVCMSLSLPLIISRHSIAYVLENSPVLSYLLFTFLGARKQNRPDMIPGGYLYAVLIGIACGALGFLVSPIWILVILLVVATCGFIIGSPEFGITLSVFLLPFLTYLRHPTVILCALIILCFMSYVRKLLLGKRTLTLSNCDLFVFVFMLFYLGGGIISYAKGTASLQSALVYIALISVYFLASNLLLNKRILGTLIKALLFSGVIVSFFGIYQQLRGEGVANWLDPSAYAYLSGRIHSTFDNPNVFASYLIMIIPFIFIRTGERTRPIFVILKIFSFVAMMGALVFTYSRGAWLGIIVALLALAIFHLRKSPKILIALFAFIPNLLLLAPRSISSRFSSIFSFLDTNIDSSVSFRFTVWKDSLQLFADKPFGGVGVGTEAFHTAFLPYSSIGAETVEHSHNLYLQIGIELGIFALFAFLLILFFTCRRCFSMEFAANETPTRPICISSFCAILALLVNGLTDYVWYNYRVCAIFWLLLGICNAAYRIGQAEQRQRDYLQSQIQNRASTDIQLSR